MCLDVLLEMSWTRALVDSCSFLAHVKGRREVISRRLPLCMGSRVTCYKSLTMYSACRMAKIENSNLKLMVFGYVKGDTISIRRLARANVFRILGISGCDVPPLNLYEDLSQHPV